MNNSDYFKLLRVLAGYNDPILSDEDAFVLLGYLILAKNRTNDQPLIQDNFKEQELMKSIVLTLQYLEESIQYRHDPTSVAKFQKSVTKCIKDFKELYGKDAISI